MSLDDITQIESAFAFSFHSNTLLRYDRSDQVSRCNVKARIINPFKPGRRNHNQGLFSFSLLRRVQRAADEASFDSRPVFDWDTISDFRSGQV